MRDRSKSGRPIILEDGKLNLFLGVQEYPYWSSSVVPANSDISYIPALKKFKATNVSVTKLKYSMKRMGKCKIVEIRVMSLLAELSLLVVLQFTLNAKNSYLHNLRSQLMFVLE